MAGKWDFGGYINGCFCPSLPSHSFFASGSSSSFLGMSSMVSFKDVHGAKRSERTFFHTFGQDEVGDDDFDEYFHKPEKKRRLTVEQAHFLEKCFEAENKLEPERKVQLAKELGLQPRQVAIWFQNRRARWKSKQLEKDFDTLQASYDSLKDDYNNLFKEKEKLQVEVVLLADKLRLKERVLGDHSNSSNLCNHHPNNVQPERIVDSTSESKDQHHVSTLIHMHQDLTSAKTDAFESNSSYVFETDNSDISQDDEDYLNQTFLPISHVLLKVEDIDYSNPTTTCYNLEISGEDHASQFWSYWDINCKM